jgi:uncharacterized membrane protein
MKGYKMEDLLFHPRFVHFPIALLSTYVLLEIIGVVFKKEFFSKAAHLILFLGVLGALVAVITGNMAEEVAEMWEDKGAIIPFGAMLEHQKWATITVWYFAAVLVLRTVAVLKKKFVGWFMYGFLILAIVGSYLVYETGDHGGKLVYKYGVGTELKKAEIEE